MGGRRAYRPLLACAGLCAAVRRLFLRHGRLFYCDASVGQNVGGTAYRTAGAHWLYRSGADAAGRLWSGICLRSVDAGNACIGDLLLYCAAASADRRVAPRSGTLPPFDAAASFADYRPAFAQQLCPIGAFYSAAPAGTKGAAAVRRWDGSGPGRLRGHSGNVAAGAAVPGGPYHCYCGSYRAGADGGAGAGPTEKPELYAGAAVPTGTDVCYGGGGRLLLFCPAAGGTDLSRIRRRPLYPDAGPAGAGYVYGYAGGRDAEGRRGVPRQYAVQYL